MAREEELPDEPERGPSPVDRAIDAYAERFGTTPSVWGLYGRVPGDELAQAIRAAIREGKPFDPTTMGVTDPPPDAVS